MSRCDRAIECKFFGCALELDPELEQLVSQTATVSAARNGLSYRAKALLVEQFVDKLLAEAPPSLR